MGVVIVVDVRLVLHLRLSCTVSGCCPMLYGHYPTPTEHLLLFLSTEISC